MKLYVSISVILYIILPPRCNPLIVTQYDEKLLFRYYEIVKKYTNETQYDADFFDENFDFANYCQELRIARILTIKDYDEITESIIHSKFGKIKPNVKEAEGMQTMNPSAELQVYTTTQYLPSFTCSDFHGNLNWHVSPAFIGGSAFLSKYQHLINHVEKQTIKKRRKLLPKLVSLIDNSAIVRVSTKNARYNLLNRRFKESHKNSAGKDVLCNLKQMLKNRLCAIATQHVNHLVIYDATRYTSYHNNQDAEKSCPLVEIKFNDEVISRKILTCVTFIVNMNATRVFYLSYKEKSRVYIVEHLPEQQNALTVTNEIEVPMVKHLKKYETAFKGISI